MKYTRCITAPAKTSCFIKILTLKGEVNNPKLNFTLKSAVSGTFLGVEITLLPVIRFRAVLTQVVFIQQRLLHLR